MSYSSSPARQHGVKVRASPGTRTRTGTRTWLTRQGLKRRKTLSSTTLSVQKRLATETEIKSLRSTVYVWSSSQLQGIRCGKESCCPTFRSGDGAVIAPAFPFSPTPTHPFTHTTLVPCWWFPWFDYIKLRVMMNSLAWSLSSGKFNSGGWATIHRRPSRTGKLTGSRTLYGDFNEEAGEPRLRVVSLGWILVFFFSWFFLFSFLFFSLFYSLSLSCPLLFTLTLFYWSVVVFRPNI